MIPRGLVMHHIYGRNAPRFRCERCGEWITNASMAGVVWSPDSWRGQEASTLMVLCKTNHCLVQGPWRHWPWEQLDNFLVFLVDNSGLRGEHWAKARRKASWE